MVNINQAVEMPLHLVVVLVVASIVLAAACLTHAWARNSDRRRSAGASGSPDLADRILGAVCEHIREGLVVEGDSVDDMFVVLGPRKDAELVRHLLASYFDEKGKAALAQSVHERICSIGRGMSERLRDESPHLRRPKEPQPVTLGYALACGAVSPGEIHSHAATTEGLLKAVMSQIETGEACWDIRSFPLRPAGSA